MTAQELKSKNKIKICPICSNQFVDKSRNNWAKYCSQGCSQIFFNKKYQAIKRIKSLDYYRKNREVRLERMREYRLNNPQIIKLSQAKYKERNLDKLRTDGRNYYWKNRQKRLNYNAGWRKNNPDYRTKNKEKIAKYERDYYRKNNLRKLEQIKKRTRVDPEFALRRRLRSELWQIVKKYHGTGKVSSRSLLKSYDIDVNKIIKKLSPLPASLKGYDIDHIKPLVKFDLTLTAQVKLAFNPDNIRLISASQNRSAGGRLSWSRRKNTHIVTTSR
ncbi:MAG TPA: hypothetical protein VJK07_02060 [Candidatus Nanoarchaeia archaeon]|nr:hypothetical protein [Candidatus Nanoarchaeia archaeon]